jgi:hypothetical protein
LLPAFGVHVDGRPVVFSACRAPLGLDGLFQPLDDDLVFVRVEVVNISTESDAAL